MTATQIITYTVYNEAAGLADKPAGLTAAAAAAIYLSTDGCEWDIRQTAGGGWELWTRQQVANKGWRPTVLRSYETDEAAATAEIIEAVMTCEWHSGVHIMTDEDYAAMLTEIEQED